MLIKLCLALFAVSLTVHAKSVLKEEANLEEDKTSQDVVKLFVPAAARSLEVVAGSNNPNDLNQNNDPNSAGNNQVDDINSTASENNVAAPLPTKKPIKNKPNKNKKPNKKKPSSNKKPNKKKARSTKRPNKKTKTKG